MQHREVICRLWFGAESLPQTKVEHVKILAAILSRNGLLDICIGPGIASTWGAIWHAFLDLCRLGFWRRSVKGWGMPIGRNITGRMSSVYNLETGTLAGTPASGQQQQ